MQALDLQYVQVAGNDDRRLYLAQHEKEQVPPEVQLRRLRIDQALRPGVYLDEGRQYHAAHPDGQHRVERRHGRAVVGDGIHRVHAGLHHFRKILTVHRRVAAQDIHQRIHVFVCGQPLQVVYGALQRGQQLLRSRPQQRHGVAHGVSGLRQCGLHGLGVPGQRGHALHGVRHLTGHGVQFLLQRL